MKLKTITTIELSSLCQLECRYCINRLIEKNSDRKRNIMAEDTFWRSLYWLNELVKRGTQQEVNLNGNGESLLDPDIVDRARATKDIIGNRSVQFCTNGIGLTRKKAVALKDAGIDRIDLSLHDAYHARRCAHMLHELGIPSFVNAGVISATHNWAGQLEPENQVNMLFSIPCHPIMEGRGYINSDGDLSPCCYDYRNLGRFGSVFDDDLLERDIAPYSICLDCHQQLQQPDKKENAA